MRSAPDKEVAFIGDVHGWAGRLAEVLAQIDCRAIFVGDLVDRGENSAQVVAQVRRLVETGVADCVLGNHEFALVQALGCEEVGIPRQATMWWAWTQVYGAEATAASYGTRLADGPEALALAMGSDLGWLARLPWYVRGEVASGDKYLIVHAGLQAAPVAAQLQELDQPAAMWWRQDYHPPALYDKSLVGVTPPDLPADTVLVSGHTPLLAPLVSDQRVCCDTSGGRPGRPLSAVVWPSRRIVQSRG